MPKVDPFKEYRPAILMAAGEKYRATVEGRDPDLDISQILPHAVGDEVTGFGMRPEVGGPLIAQAEADVAASTVAHLAVAKDMAESGGVKGLLGKTEVFVMRVVEHAYLTPEAIEMADVIRGIGGAGLPPIDAEPNSR